MINIQKELLSAAKYARQGWSYEQKLTKKAKERKESFEKGLELARSLITDWTSPEQLSEKMGISASTIKKYLMILVRENKAERRKTVRPGIGRWTYQYRRI